MTLQNAPRDLDKIERLIKIKREQKEEAKYIEHTKRLGAEIEMLKEVVLFLISKNSR
jgi:hypothetical protein